MAADRFGICPAAARMAQITPRRGIAQQMRAGCINTELRQFGQRAGHAVQPPKPANIGECSHQRPLALGLAQQGRQSGPRCRRVKPRQGIHGTGESVIRATFGHEKQGGSLPHRQIG